MSDEAPKKAAATGAPAWVMTFADLMSLLMCFFVLLLSFSEMDVAKYKQIAGSMKEAFGVQRKNPVKEPPKGINIIATEFSAGRPNPTPFNVVEQLTSDDMKQFLDTGGRQRKAGDDGKPAKGKAQAGKDDKNNQAAAQNGSGGQEQTQNQGGGAEGKSDQSQDASAQAKDALDKQVVMLPKEDALDALKAKQAVERERKLQQSAKRIRAALNTEIKDGAVDVETEGQKIVIRIREKASFPSGAAELREEFRPILDRVGQILKETEGRIIVSGHTDDRPIATSLYRSNWDLAASRAVSVVHELIDVSRIPSGRFSIEGLAETQPVVPNDTPENRARNRRVEIKLLQGDDLEAKGTIGTMPAATAPAVTPDRPVPPVQQPKQRPATDDPFVRKPG